MANAPKGKQRQFKCFDEEWQLIEEIANRRGIIRGGVASRSELLRTLIREEAERLDIPFRIAADEAPRG